jgi:PAS domain S-box-containing protein
MLDEVRRPDPRTTLDALHVALSQAPVNINILRGADLVFELAHPLTVKALGARQVVGLPLLEAVPELVDQDTPFLVRHVFDTGQRIDGHEKLVRLLVENSDQLRDTFWTFSYLPIRDGAGKVDGVLTVSIEVTEQVRERRQTEASQRHLQHLVSHFNAGIAQARLTGDIVRTNERYRQLVGRTEADMQRLRIQQLVHDETDAAEQFRELVEMGTAFATRLRHVRPDGSVAWLQNSVSRFEDREGRPQGVVVVALEQCAEAASH